MLSTAFVTGANRGIGLGIVNELLKQPGIKMVIAGCRSVKNAKELELLRAKHASVLRIIEVDVSADESVKGAAKQVELLLGPDTRLDLLINNAGLYGRENVDPKSPKMDACIPHFVVNSIGPMLTTAAFLPFLKRSPSAGGAPAKIINISSFLGSIKSCVGTAQIPDRNAPYGMSKAALNWYTKAFAGDEPDLVCVSVCPGWVKTEMGGPNAQISVEQSASWIVRRSAELTLADSGTYFNFSGALPF